MQYADVALSVRTKTRQDVFTYAIPPALLVDLSIGQRVIVPFAGRTLTGVVTQFRLKPPKTARGIKEIKRLAEPFALIDEQTIELARAVATRYAATLGDVLASALPKPAPRTSKKMIIQFPEAKKTIAHGGIYGLYAPRRQRLQQYLWLITKLMAQGEQALVLFVSHEKAMTFQEILATQSIDSLLLPQASATSEAYSAWVNARAGQHIVVVGTRKSIFLPLVKGGAIIIDEPSEFGYKEEQFPYYHAVTVAKARAATEGLTVFLGDVAPRLVEWQEMQQKKLTVVHLPKLLAPTVTLIDTSNCRGIFSEAVIDHMRRTMQNNGRVCLFFNRKGKGRFYRCLECEVAIYCPHCDTLLHVESISNETRLVCAQCGYEISPPYRCESCQSYRLGSAGLGVESFAKIVSEHFPEAKIATLSKDGDNFVEEADIVVATAQLFSRSLTKPYDLLVVFRLDQILHGSSFDTNEQAYLLLNRLAERAKQLLLPTSEPDHQVVRAFCDANMAVFYANELAIRKNAGYPPAISFIRLMIADTDKNKANAEATKLYEQLQLTIMPDHLIPPSPIGSGKRRDKYRYQVIVKIKLTDELLKMIPSNWQVDPEPENLS